MPGTQLPSGLFLVTLNTKGWGSLINTNTQLTHDQIGSMLTAASSSITATVIVLNVTNGVTGPPAIGASNPSIGTVTGTGDDATINSNFTNVSTEVNNLVTDVTNLRVAVQATNTLLIEVRDKLNETLAAIRKDTGVAILNEQVT